MELKLNAQQVEAAIRGGLPEASRNGLRVECVDRAYGRVRIPFRPEFIRPGGVVSGPALFSAADSAMYALVLAHVGPELMAVTADCSIRFLNKAQPGDIVAEARLLKLGRRLAVMEVALRTGEARDLVAHATGTYALPEPAFGGNDNGARA